MVRSILAGNEVVVGVVVGVAVYVMNLGAARQLVPERPLHDNDVL
jgi:predicted RecA/RadA family phage recombinase